jgi:hypothetical protein
MIKTDPNRRELSNSCIAKLIKGMGYTWKIDDITADIPSPGWIRVYGLMIDPLKDESTPVPSSHSSNSLSDKDSDPSSDDRDSSKAE